MVQNLLFILLLKSLTVDCFDPTKIDYCNMRCQNGFVSSGCECSRRGLRRDITTEMQSFRETILKLHNDIRNKVAKGELLRENYPKSSRMMALNYDLELEYLARCYGVTWLGRKTDICKLTSFCRGRKDPTQNIYGESEKNVKPEFLDAAVKSWYDNYASIPYRERPYIIRRYQPSGDGTIFTQLVWGAYTRVGCARIWNAENPYPDFRYTLVCNYAASDDMCPGNVKPNPVYRIGEPCSECRSLRCNNQTEGGIYDALCGPVKPVPRQIPEIPKEKGLKRGGFRTALKSDTKDDAKGKSGMGKIQFQEFLLALVLYVAILNGSFQ